MNTDLQGFYNYAMDLHMVAMRQCALSAINQFLEQDPKDGEPFVVNVPATLHEPLAKHLADFLGQLQFMATADAPDRASFN